MDFKDIYHISKGALDVGKLRFQSDGVSFKSTVSAKHVQVKHSDIDTAEWLRVSKGFGLKIMSREGNVFKFDGFKDSDYGDVKEFFKHHFGKDLKDLELCVKGWNWGEPVFKGSLLSFLVDSKTAFEIPLNEVSQATHGKNEVTLEFHQNESAPVSLVEMRFHIPNTEGEEDPVQNFHEKVLAKADVMQATGDALVSFSEMQCLTPRGRYTIKVFPSFLWAHGKTYNYKIPFSSITRFFLLPHNDQRQMFFVIGVDPPLRQGQTRYSFFILLLANDERCEVSLAMSQEEVAEKYSGKLSKEMEGPLYELFSRLMRVLVNKRITVPGSFVNKHNQHAIACSSKAASGYLYPLDKGFIFVHKPALFVKFEDISTVNFARMHSSGSGASRSFDFELNLKDGNIFRFNSVLKDDYGRLHQFVVNKNLRIQNKPKNAGVTYNDEDSDSASEHDAYLERMKAEGEERDSEDEDSDFVAGEGGSEDELEYDSEAKISGMDSEEEEERPERPPKKKQSKPNPTKKRKREKDNVGEGKGKKRAKKDPNAPKKPLSAYMLFLQDKRAGIKAKYPGSSVAEIAKKGGELWNAQKDRTKWEEEAKKLKAQYQRDLAEYEASGKAHSSSSVSPTKGGAVAKKSSKSSKKHSTGSSVQSSKFKSAEFVESDDESSGAEQTKKHTTRSARGGEEHVSLRESGSESEADMTSDEESD